MIRIKHAHTPELRDEVYALRYRAYLSEGAIPPNAAQRFEDVYDSQTNHILWALTEHEKVIGSIRTTWFDPEQPHLGMPELHGYREDVAAQVPSGARLFSGNRFVTDPARTDRDALFAMLLLRHHVMAAAHGRCEWALAAVRGNHVPFYRRVLRLRQISEARLYPGLTSQMYLTACRFSENIGDVYATTPQLRPRGYEHVLLDDVHRDIWEIGLPVEV